MIKGGKGGLVNNGILTALVILRTLSGVVIPLDSVWSGLLEDLR